QPRPRGRRPPSRVGPARDAGHERRPLRHRAGGDRAAADRARARARRRQPGKGGRRARHQPEHAPEEDHRPEHRRPEGPRLCVSRLRLPLLYAIVDPLDTNRTPAELAAAYLAGGARLLQLRLKGVSSRELYTAALAIRAATRAAGALFVV